jgi:hypothetical protein
MRLGVNRSDCSCAWDWRSSSCGLCCRWCSLRARERRLCCHSRASCCRVGSRAFASVVISPRKLCSPRYTTACAWPPSSSVWERRMRSHLLRDCSRACPRRSTNSASALLSRSRSCRSWPRTSNECRRLADCAVDRPRVYARSRGLPCQCWKEHWSARWHWPQPWIRAAMGDHAMSHSRSAKPSVSHCSAGSWRCAWALSACCRLASPRGYR